MIERMKALLRENSMCVLATCTGDRPHCSLMAYIMDERGEALYMVTLNTSRKYENIMRNPYVSLLVDTRAAASGAERAGIKALTVSGVSSAVRDEAERELILSRVEQSHPHLKELARHPDTEVIAVKPLSFLLLDGPTNAHYAEA